MIGGIDFWREANPDNRGFWPGEPFWGKGYMTEALLPLTDYAFNDLGFEKLIFSNALGNNKSRRIKEKTGATFIELRPANYVDPQVKQAEMWELTKENWVKFKSNH